jgi:hypothetical protein
VPGGPTLAPKLFSKLGNAKYKLICNCIDASYVKGIVDNQRNQSNVSTGCNCHSDNIKGTEW